MPGALVTLQLQSQVAPQIAQTADQYKALAAAEQKAEQGAARYAQSLQKVALADAKTATEEQRKAVQTANAAKAQDQAALSALRLASAQEKQARASSLSGQFLDGLKSGLLGIVGPLALANTALVAVIGTANSFKEAFAFKAQLDQTTNAIKTQLAGVRNGNQVFDEAAAFGNRYKIAQDEIAATLQASTVVLRNSKSSVTDLLTQISLLQATTPDKPISEAARALRELSTGDVTTFRELFNASAADANRMKNEIAGGADAVQVLARYLKDSGASMELLEARTRGATGAINDQIVAQKELQLAQGEFAAGPGVIITETYTGVLKILTGALTQGAQAQKFYNDVMAEAPAGGSGGFDFQQGVTFANAYTTSLSAAAQAAQAAAAQIQFFGQAADISARASVADAAAKDAQQAKTALLTAESNKAAQAFLSMNPQIDAAGVAALVAAGKLDPLIGRLIALQLESGKARDELIKLANAQNQQKVNQIITLRSASGISSGRGGGSDALAEGQAFADSLKRQADAAKQATADQIAYAKATGDTATARKLLNTQLAAAKRAGDLGEQARIIDSLAALDKKGGAGRISAAESTALRLNDIARTSGDDRARIERENQEKLRDAQEDFDVRRARAIEDFERQRTRLLAQGQRGQAARLASDFARDQQRAQEDFNRQTRRTVRNNQESLGDQSTRVGNSVESVNARTAARGGTVQGLPSAPGTGGDLPALPSANAKQSAGTLTIQGVINMDGKAVGTGVWPTIEILVDQELAVSLQAIGVPGSGQASVGGAG